MFARAGTAATVTSSRAAKGTASIEQFFWSTLSTDNDSCLSNLERLSNDAEVSPELEAKLTVEMRRLFRNRCVGLFNFYSMKMPFKHSMTMLESSFRLMKHFC
jgi:hypothetical protein